MTRCKKGTRKNKKTGNCESYTTKSEKTKRCLKGTRKNKKTGNCEKKIEMILKNKSISINKMSAPIINEQVMNENYIEVNVNNLKEIKQIVKRIKRDLDNNIYELKLFTLSKNEKKDRKDYEEKLYNMSIADSQNREEDNKLREKYLDYLKKICKNEMEHPEPTHIYELVDYKEVLKELKSVKLNKDLSEEEIKIVEMIINNWKFR
jgi:hypothetical protein